MATSTAVTNKRDDPDCKLGRSGPSEPTCSCGRAERRSNALPIVRSCRHDATEHAELDQQYASVGARAQRGQTPQSQPRAGGARQDDNTRQDKRRRRENSDQRRDSSHARRSRDLTASGTPMATTHNRALKPTGRTKHVKRVHCDRRGRGIGADAAACPPSAGVAASTIAATAAIAQADERPRAESANAISATPVARTCTIQAIPHSVWLIKVRSSAPLSASTPFNMRD